MEHEIESSSLKPNLVKSPAEARNVLRRIPAGWLALLLPLLTPATVQAGECQPPKKQGRYVEVIGVALPGTDVNVRLLDVESGGASFDVGLEDQQGVRLDTVTVPGGERTTGEVGVTFAGALADALDRDLTYRIVAEGPEGEPLMEPFPFLVTLECTQGAPCDFRPIVGFETDALVASPELELALAQYPSCRLATNLLELKEARPELLRDIQTLEHQLGRLPIAAKGGCTYAWLVTVAPPGSEWSSYHVELPSDENPFAEIMGVENGAEQCFGMQLRHPSSATQKTFVRKGRSRLKMSTVCLSGSAFCAPCAGVVDLDVGMTVCAAADAAALCEGGQAHARTDQWMIYDVDSPTPFTPLQVSSLVDVQAAYSLAGSDEAWETLWTEGADQTVFDAPATARLTASTWLHGSVDGPSAESTCTAQNGAAAFAFNDSSNLFTLVGQAVSGCTAIPAVRAVIVPPGSGVIQRDGGIKLKRWRDHPGGDG